MTQFEVEILSMIWRSAASFETIHFLVNGSALFADLHLAIYILSSVFEVAESVESPRVIRTL